jgi:hypothetical protein
MHNSISISALKLWMDIVLLRVVRVQHFKEMYSSAEHVRIDIDANAVVYELILAHIYATHIAY